MRSLTVELTSTSDGPARAPNPGADDDGDPADLPVDDLDLSGVDAGPNLEPQLTDTRGDRTRTADGPGGPVEGGEEPVAGGVDFDAAVTFELTTDQGVVRQ